MPAPLFIAVEPFNLSDGEKWQKYCEFAKIPALEDLVTLDIALAPRIPFQLDAEYWARMVKENDGLPFFRDYTQLVRLVADVPRKQFLGIYRNPESHIQEPPAYGFNFAGYDLIEEETQISALTNCGGFPEAFSNSELNKFGLIERFDRAQQIQTALPKHYPDEPHAKCELYAIWYFREFPETNRNVWVTSEEILAAIHESRDQADKKFLRAFPELNK